MFVRDPGDLQQRTEHLRNRSTLTDFADHGGMHIGQPHAFSARHQAVSQVDSLPRFNGGLHRAHAVRLGRLVAHYELLRPGQRHREHQNVLLKTKLDAFLGLFGQFFDLGADGFKQALLRRRCTSRFRRFVDYAFERIANASHPEFRLAHPLPFQQCRPQGTGLRQHFHGEFTASPVEGAVQEDADLDLIRHTGPSSTPASRTAIPAGVRGNDLAPPCAATPCHNALGLLRIAPAGTSDAERVMAVPCAQLLETVRQASISFARRQKSMSCAKCIVSHTDSGPGPVARMITSWRRASSSRRGPRRSPCCHTTPPGPPSPAVRTPARGCSRESYPGPPVPAPLFSVSLVW